MSEGAVSGNRRIAGPLLEINRQQKQGSQVVFRAGAASGQAGPEAGSLVDVVDPIRSVFIGAAVPTRVVLSPSLKK